MKVIRIFLILSIISFFNLELDAQAVKRVVIDAGHGGKDPGAIGYSGLKEKDVALSVSLKLGNYIKENFKDVEVIYTRDKDIFLELHERARIANKANADLFISLHANASDNRTAYGSETFVLGLHRSEANLEVAKRENAVIELEEDADENYSFNPNSPEGHIMMSLAQNAYLEQSIELASKIQDQFRERVNRKDRGVKQAGFFVLYKTTMPSVLVELGFISHANEEKFLESVQGQDYMASAIYRAFKEYKQHMDELWVENKNNNRDNPEEDALIYRIQVFATKQKADKNAKVFKDFSNIYIEDAGNGIFRHMVNEYPSYEAASKDILNVVKLGYKGAYIVSYKGEKRIQVYDATTNTD